MLTTRYARDPRSPGLQYSLSTSNGIDIASNVNSISNGWYILGCVIIPIASMTSPVLVPKCQSESHYPSIHLKKLWLLWISIASLSAQHLSVSSLHGPCNAPVVPEVTTMQPSLIQLQLPSGFTNLTQILVLDLRELRQSISMVILHQESSTCKNFRSCIPLDLTIHVVRFYLESPIRHQRPLSPPQLAHPSRSWAQVS